MTPEEKENQILNQVVEIEGEILTQQDEFNIIAEKGIEYIIGELTLYIKPLKIRQLELLFELESLNRDNSFSMPEKVSKIIDKLAIILKIERDLLLDNFELEDLKIIIELLSYSMLQGKKLFKKKIITHKDLSSKIALN